VPQPIDVGSILGGRYKVTGRILASAENDVILDGLDQTLNRPVSILVSAVANSTFLTQSAREVATGERVSNVSVLDMGTQDGSTYLIAARTSPADLLDLVVPTEPVATDPYENQAIYQEPFFTDTLGTEIFGSARDAAPSGSPYVYEDNSPMTPAHAAPPVRRPVEQPRIAETPTAAVPAAPEVSPAVVSQASAAAAAAAAEPKVTLWSDDDYSFINDDHDASMGQARKAGTFPAEVRDASDAYDSNDEPEAADDDGNAPRSGGRWLTGVIVTVLVVAALIFAVSHISNLFNGANTADGKNTTVASQPSTPGGTKAPSKAPAPVAVAPSIKAITDVTVYAPGAQRYGDMFLARLKDSFDNNKGTYWPTVEFSNDTFADVTTSIDLAIELKQEATISSVTINQIAGSGGQFNILTNSKPSLDGAVKIGSGSFSAPDFTMKAADGVKAKYVIISFTQLPRLQPFVTYPYGLKIAEISVK
jgi:hypothetical protein